MERRFVAIVAGVVVLLVVGALVIARDDTRHGPPRLPIALSGSGSGSADAALAPYGETVYHLDAGVPSLDGSARAYRVSADDPKMVAPRLAAAVGLHGDPSTDGETLTLTDGATQLTVSSHDWSYARDSNGTVSSSPTSEPVPTDLVPTEDEAKTAALGLLRRAGFDMTGAAVTTDLGADQRFVRIDPVVDGFGTEGTGATVIVGANGVIDAASGTLGTVVAADEYPVAGTKVAVDRLNAGQGLVGPQPLAAQDTPATEPALAPAASDEPPATDDAVNEGEASAVSPSPPGSGQGPDSEPPSNQTNPPPTPPGAALTRPG